MLPNLTVRFLHLHFSPYMVRLMVSFKRILPAFLSRFRNDLLTRFSVVALGITAIVAIALNWGITRELEWLALSSEADSAADQVSSILTPNLFPSDFDSPLDPARYAQIDDLIRQNVLSEHIVRVKIWNRQGLLLYSDEKDLAGQFYPMSEELEEALAGEIAMEVSSLNKEENKVEREMYSRLMEIYVPFQFESAPQIVGAYEIYHDLSILEINILKANQFVSWSVGFGFVILYGSLFMLVRRASRELVQRNEQNTRLYEETKLQLTKRKEAEEQVQHQLSRLTALREIDQSITGSIDLRITLKVLLDHVAFQLSVDAADILLFNHFTQTFDYAAGRGFRTAALQKTRLRLGEGFAGKAAHEGRLIFISDLGSELDGLSRAPLLPDEGFRSYCGVPLISKGKMYGVLEIFHRSQLNSDPDWFGFLETLAGQAAIAIDNATLFIELQRSNLDLNLAYDATLTGWGKALELRDKETQGHTQRVAGLSEILGRAMGLSDAQLGYARQGALLHDIGKMGIPDSILLKVGPLTAEEWDIMRKHPSFAYEMLSPVKYLRPALDIPYCHHEKWDGTGYPRGLKGEEIPLVARIFAVVDVWDALTSDRPYRPAWTEEATLAYIDEQAGKHFDPAVVHVFLKLRKPKETIENQPV